MELLPLWIDSLTPDMVAKAEKELGETESIRIQALVDLRCLIKSEKDFYPRDDDVFLLRFLRYKKFNTKKAFTTLKNFYTFKKNYSGIITDFTPSQIKEILYMNVMFPIPKRVPDGAVVSIFRPACYDIDAGPAEYLLGAALLTVELTLENQANQICGAIAVIDFRDCGLNHMKHFASPRFLYRSFKLLQDCLPMRIKAIHVVNEPLICRVIFNIHKFILSEKVRNRFHFHGYDLKSLQNLIPEEILPVELGGTLKFINYEEEYLRLLSKEDYFEKLKQYGFQNKKNLVH